MPYLYNWGIYSSKRYTTIDELGQVTDFGFRLAEVWNDIEYLVCKPDFDDVDLEMILEACLEALDKRHPKKKEW